MASDRHRVRRSFVPVDVLAAVSYLDTTTWVLPRMMPRGEFAGLLESLEAAYCDGKVRVVPEMIRRPDGSWRYVLHVHQIRPATLALIASASIPMSLFEIEVALDLIVATQADAVELRNYVVHRLIKNNRPTEPIKWMGTGERKTAYYSFGLTRGNKIAVYADRATKTGAGRPCLHIEWRIRGAQELRKQQLTTPAALVAMNYTNFWANRLQMWRPPSEATLRDAFATSRSTGSRATARSATAITRLTQRMLREVFCSEIGSMPAHDLLLWLNAHQICRTRPSSLFTTERCSWMLPAATNALWG